MKPNILIFIYFLAGITFAVAAINLLIGLRKGSEKTYLFLGLIGLCVGMYYLLFPYISFAQPLSIETKLGFFFFLGNFALLPWFFCHYTSYCKNTIQWLLTTGMIISFLLLLFTNDFNRPIFWNIFAHIVLVGIIIFGFKAALFQKGKGELLSANLLLGSLVIFSILALDDIVKIHLPSLYPFHLPNNILLFDYSLVLFMVIMGLKLSRDLQQKYRMQKIILTKERRWGDLLKKVHLLVIGIDKTGNINYVNPFFLELTGFHKKDLIGKHYMHILPENKRKSQGELDSIINTPKDLPHYENNIITKSGGEKAISWSLVKVYNESGDYISSISIGSDITDRQNAFEEINILKSKLEDENFLLKEELNKVHKVGEIKGKSDAIHYVLQRALQVAPTDATVLLEGETGVGKELVANYIQQNSNRSKKPFVKINCATIPANLLESELFGHFKGAFTGADRTKKGLFEVADGGTLFLDEIGDFPFELQAKLLRFLQEGEYLPLGSENIRKADVRIIAATNQGLLKMIEEKQFRNDLYYRLYVYPITIPALRDRTDDIPEFVAHFIELYAKKHNKSIKKVSKRVIDKLKSYDWPGNVRELENILERAVIISDSDTLKEKDISLFSGENGDKSKRNSNHFDTLQTMEKEHICTVLEHCSWQVHGPDGAAQILGINPNTLRSRMKKLNIIKP
ncbi:MAG: PAS domain S-box protein [Bacteroidales bacterium]|nr:PAS domain S-box protein [Bacteroidales bacterium]